MRLTIISLFLGISAVFSTNVNSQTASVNEENTKRITGTITDSFGDPVIGANIAVKGTKEGAISDVNGQFSLTVAPDARLVVSYLGYVTQELAVGNQTDLKISLVESLTSLEDVVVIGYGTQKKETLTGAVAAITSEELLKTKTNNIQNALIGRISGVQVNQRTSEPGTFNSDFTIRGMGNPLVVVDGVPRENMTRLDGNEVESISILKDASAAVYGSRAANGVVLITTKKGRSGQKFAFEYNGYAGVQNMMLNVELLDAVQYMRMYNEKAANSYSGMPYTAAQIAEYQDGTKQSSDWLSLIMKDSPILQQHSFSASGASDKIDYFVNFGYYQQDGWFKSNSLNYDRFNLRSNVTARLAKGLTGKIFLNLTTDTRNQQPESTWRVIDRGVYLTSPLNPPYYNNDPQKPTTSNIYSLIDPANGYNWNKGRFIQSNMELEYQIPGVDGLSVKGMYSYDYTEDEWKIFRHAFTLYDLNGAPSVNSYSPMRRVWWGGVNTLLQASANYEKTFNKVHKIGATVVYEESDREADNFWAERNVLLASVEQLFAANPSGQTIGQETGKVIPREDDNNASRDGLYHYANKGFIGRFTYDYASKYLFEFSFRYDGSSRFAPGHQWGFFPVASAGWRLSEEKFIKDNFLFVSNLKLRGSYGQMGDEGTSTYQFLTGYDYGSNQGGYLFGTSYTYAATSRGIPNTLVTWSTSTVADIGLDVDLWNGKLGIIADLYRRDRTGLLATRSVSLPDQLGATVAQENINGDMTQGFELTFTHRSRVRDLDYNLSAGVFMNRTKLIHNEESAAVDSYDRWRNKNTDRWSNIMWGYGYAGQYTSFDEIFAGPVISNGNGYMLPGDLRLEDWNGDGVINSLDEHPIAINTRDDNGVHPMLNYNFSIGAEWKGIDANLLFQGAGMAWRTYQSANSGHDDRSDQYMGIGSRNSNGFTEFYDRWHRADEMNASKWQQWIPGKYPSAYQGIGQRNWQMTNLSNFWIWNTAYLRLKSIEIGYTLPASFTRKMGANVRIFANSYNTLTWTSMPIGDPEVKDGDTYPLSRSFSFGLNVKF